MKIVRAKFIHAIEVDGLKSTHLYLNAEFHGCTMTLEAPCLVIRANKGGLPCHIPIASNVTHMWPVDEAKKK